MSDMGQAALQYVRRGWSVVPAHTVVDHVCSCNRLDCGAAGKHARVPWAQYQRVRPSETEVLRWWLRWPTANIAIVTGAVSGLVVLDVDPRHGGDSSYDALWSVSREGTETVTVLTGGGGQHYYYQHPGCPVSNGANLLPGVDLRGDGGLVIAPPSQHASGSPYLWEIGYGPEEHDILPLPPELTALLDGYHPAIGDRAEPSGELVVGDYIAGKVPIPEGDRNTRLTQLAGALLSDGIPLDAVVGSLLGINAVACQPPLNPEEVRAIARSIHGREQRKREALEYVQTRQVTPDDAADLSNPDRLDLARALWAELGIPDVQDWLCVLDAEGTNYELELNGATVRLGPALISAQTKIRDTLLPYAQTALRRLKTEAWTEYCVQLARLARPETVGVLRDTERLAEWQQEFIAQQRPVDHPLGARRDALRSGPILYDGRLATRTRPFLLFLELAYAEKLTSHQLGRLLRLSGWSYQAIRVGEGEFMKVWLAPEKEVAP